MTKLPDSLTPALRPPRQPGQLRVRISAQMQGVLQLMIETGAPVRDAARQVGMSPDAAVKAFKRPHVKVLYAQMVREARANAGQRAFLRVDHLSRTADSEHVRLEAGKWIAGVEGIAPLKRVAGVFMHQHQFAGFAYGRGGVSGYDDESGDVIDG